MLFLLLSEIFIAFIVGHPKQILCSCNIIYAIYTCNLYIIINVYLIYFSYILIAFSTLSAQIRKLLIHNREIITLDTVRNLKYFIHLIRDQIHNLQVGTVLLYFHMCEKKKNK